MFPLLPGLIAGGASLLGSVFSSDTSAQNTQAQIAAQEQMQGQSEQFNAQQAQMNRDYQTQMSNTAYQRASADMSKAGLNPAMMFGSGSAASSPAGSTASIGTPNVPMPQKTSPLAGLGDAVRTAMSTAVQSKEMDKTSDVIANLDLQNKDLQRKLDAGGPEAEVYRTRASGTEMMAGANFKDQLMNMNIPDEQKAKIWNAMPEEVKKGVVWSEVAAKSAKDASTVATAPAGIAKSYLDLIPGYKFLTGSAKGAATKDYQYGGPQMRQWMKDNQYLGGREPGTGGSFD